MATGAPTVPSTDQVQAYLAAYQIESVVEEAVNDAVLKQVKDPYEHIAQLLMKHSLKTQPATEGNRKSSRRVSLGGVPVIGNERRVSLSMETYQYDTDKKRAPEGVAVQENDSFRKKSLQVAGEAGTGGSLVPTTLSGEELDRQFAKKDETIAMTQQVEDMLKKFFDTMDADGNGEVTKDEAVAHWGKNFAKVNATSMFNEVDEDGNESVSWEEFLAFWKNVVASGYSQDDILEEVEMMIEGGSWVDFDDGRTT